MSALTLLQNATAIAPNLTLPFSAVGGTGPYAYAVVPGGGSGGSINSSTGLYTSGPTTGIDIIKVTDSLMNVATAQMLVGSPVQLVCDIIQNGLSLANGRVWIYDQKVFEPIDYGIYIPISIVSCKAFSNINAPDGSVPGFNSNQSVNMSAQLDINIKSRSTAARDRKEEVIMALASTYSEQQQELNSFRLFQLPTNIVDLSYLDGPAFPYSFGITAYIQYVIKKTVSVPYYNSFPQPSVLTNS